MPALLQLTINPHAPAGERLSTASLYPLTGVVDDYLHSPRSPGTRSPSPSSPSRTSARRASTPMNLADGSLANLHRRSPSRHGDLSDGESALGDYDGAVAALELDFDDGGKGRRERYAGERRRAATEDGVTFGALQAPSSYSFPSSDSLQHVDSQGGYAYGSEDNLPLTDSAALPAGYDESEWPSAPHESFAIQQPQFLSVTAPSRRSSSDLPRRSYPKGSPLGRSNTLQKAAAGLRRMSLRVVNLAGLPDVAEASPSTNAHPHRRLSDQEDGEIELGKVQEVENGATFEEESVWVDEVLRGRTLYLFGPENRFRRACASLLRWKLTEPLILLAIFAQVIVQIVQTSSNVYANPLPTQGYFHGRTSYTLFALFSLYTVELLVRVVAVGGIFNPPLPYLSTTSPDPIPPSFSDVYPPPLHPRTATASSRAHSRKDASSSTQASAPFTHSIRRQRASYQEAFLRHSWNRVDAVAVVSFWISFGLATAGLEASQGLYVFRALSVLRVSRLLAVTAGTSTILHSLKRATPQLASVALFVAFAMTLLAIIGVQSFSGSFRRVCQWNDPVGVFASVTSNQHCGGFIDRVTGTRMGYILNSTGLPTPGGGKGYICAAGSYCIESKNPDAGVLSFDNFPAALYQVVVVASANTWTVVMYAMMDTDGYAACIFFIVSLVVLQYWLINLFVAVITSTFSSILDETRVSAFSAERKGGKATASIIKNVHQGPSFLRRVMDKTRLVWVAAALTGVAVQATRTSTMSAAQLATLSTTELCFTIAFGVEIVLRALATLPDWRSMFGSAENIADLFLALVTSLLQISAIKNSTAYRWLTIFQIARFYRVVLAIPRTRRLLVQVLGTFTALLNTMGFLLLMNGLAALIAVQFFRGVPQPALNETPEMTFSSYWNSFLAMYQIYSSENWTDVANNVLTAEMGIFQLFCAAVFLSAWLLTGYFILLGLFVSVISENFALAEDDKHQQQMKAYIKRNEPVVDQRSYFQRLNPYYRAATRPASVHLASIGPPTEKRVILDDMSVSRVDERMKSTDGPDAYLKARRERQALRLNVRTVSAGSHAATDGVELPVDVMLDDGDADPARSVARRRRAHQLEMIAARPSYDVSLWLFSQGNPIRRFCQRLVEPANDEERINGRPSVRRERIAFQVLVFSGVLGSIVIAAYATPVYRRTYFLDNGPIRFTWFNLTEATLSITLIVEFLVKILADGFIFSPNAYLSSVWNGLDFFVLLTLVVNVVTQLVSGGGVSRFTRSLKAFRALRLINLSVAMRSTFFDVLIVGAGQILDAGLLAVLYIIPFAIWGLNVFNGALWFCSDPTVTTKAQCAGEFLSSPVSDWNLLAPRVWANPYVWKFDDFQSSLLILFEIISLEGWIAVMESAMSIVGLDMQPVQDASQFSGGLFFVFYNLVGSSFILTLFVSIIITAFSRRSGQALLTSEQRQWIDLRALIRRQRPSKRPRHRPQSRIRSWCYERAIQKHGWWSRTMRSLYVVHIVVLTTQATTNPLWADQLRNYVFLAFTIVYLIDGSVRALGLGASNFLKNPWNVFDFVTVVGTAATTVPVLLGTTSQAAVQLQKLFLVAIAFKLVQKNDSLNQLFKTAASSLIPLLNLFGLWGILFLTWAIFQVEVFSLTRWGVMGAHNTSYQAFSKALVMLVLASTGEGWNAYMHDYAVSFPLCTESPNFLLSDCGSQSWAYGLFISWNIISMYLFANLVLSAVVTNFSSVVLERERTIDREEMRIFKQAWSEVDHGRTGFLQSKDIASFLGRLTGIFEVKIYRDEWSVKRLKLDALHPSSPVLERSPYSDVKSVPPRFEGSLDLVTLARLVAGIDRQEVRCRKLLYNRLFTEAQLDAAQSPKGISFTDMLVLLARYKLVHPKALQLDEAVARRAKEKKVSNRIENEMIRSFLKSIALRRQFHATREAARQAGLPAIVIGTSERGRGGEEEMELCDRRT